MLDAVLHRRLRVGGSVALAGRAVSLLEAVQDGRARCPFARLPGALVGAAQAFGGAVVQTRHVSIKLHP